MSEITTSTLIACAALAVAMWSAWTAHRAYRLAKGQTEPGVSLDLSPMPGQRGWFEVRISITDRAPYKITAKSLRVIWPPSARLVGWEDGTKPDACGQILPRQAMPPEKGSRKISLRTRLASAGSKTDRDYEDHFLFVSPNKQTLLLGQRILLRLTLLTSEPRGRHMTFNVLRAV